MVDGRRLESRVLGPIAVEISGPMTHDPRPSTIDHRPPSGRELRLRILVEDPPPGVTFAVQLGRDQLLPPVTVTPDRLVFEFLVRMAPGTSGPPRLLGPATQGPPTGRFVYLNSGKRAGQKDTEWDRRAKIPLAGITRTLIRTHHATAGSYAGSTSTGSRPTWGRPDLRRRPTHRWRMEGRHLKEHPTRNRTRTNARC